MASENTSSQSTREERFVQSIINRCIQNKGDAARLRLADNVATEYQSWEILGSLGVDLENDHQRQPFVTVAAAIAKAKTEANGNHTLGSTLAACYEEGSESNQAKARIRRLLACQSLPEVCRVLRPVFSLINSKSNQTLDYARLLKQIRRFAFEDARTQVKAQWAQEFYSQRNKPEAGDFVA